MVNHKAHEALKELEAAGAVKTTDVAKAEISARWYVRGEQVAWLEHTGRFGVKVAGQRYVTVRPDTYLADGQWAYTDQAGSGVRGRGSESVEPVTCPNCFLRVPPGTECPSCGEVPVC